MNVKDRIPHLQSIPLTPVQSSQIHSIGYDPEIKVMVIQFPRKGDDGPAPGAKYSYDNVSQETFDAFSAAESKGSFFGKTFKNNATDYPFHRLPDPVEALPEAA